MTRRALEAIAMAELLRRLLDGRGDFTPPGGALVQSYRDVAREARRFAREAGKRWE